MGMRNKLWILIAILFSFLAMTGCGNSERVHKSWIVPPEGPRYEDSDILNNLKSRLSANPDLKDLAVNISVKNGEVSIDGLVDNQAQADQITMQAWLVDGVQRVDNQTHLKR